MSAQINLNLISETLNLLSMLHLDFREYGAKIRHKSYSSRTKIRDLVKKYPVQISFRAFIIHTARHDLMAHMSICGLWDFNAEHNT